MRILAFSTGERPPSRALVFKAPGPRRGALDHHLSWNPPTSRTEPPLQITESNIEKILTGDDTLHKLGSLPPTGKGRASTTQTSLKLSPQTNRSRARCLLVNRKCETGTTAQCERGYGMRMYRMLPFLLAAVSTLASAGTLSIFETGTGSGTIGNTNFNNASFTITASANTANTIPFNSTSVTGFWLPVTSASIDIAGVGTYEFTSGLEYFDNDTDEIVGLSQASGADLYDGPSGDPDFATWNFQTSIGPVMGTAGLLQWNLCCVNTDGGPLRFNPESSPVTFDATLAGSSVVPEPASLTLLISGIAFANVFRRRRRIG
jgi:hypothetical protein